MIKKLTWAIISCAALAACAQSVPTTSNMSLAATPSAPAPGVDTAVSSATPVSAGASDELGWYIPRANEAQRLMLEASAAPTH